MVFISILLGFVCVVVLVILVLCYEPESYTTREDMSNGRYYMTFIFSIVGMFFCAYMALDEFIENKAKEEVISYAGSDLKYQGETDVVITKKYCVVTSAGEVKVFEATCSEVKNKK